MVLTSPLLCTDTGPCAPYQLIIHKGKEKGQLSFSFLACEMGIITDLPHSGLGGLSSACWAPRREAHRGQVLVPGSQSQSGVGDSHPGLAGSEVHALPVGPTT